MDKSTLVWFGGRVRSQALSCETPPLFLFLFFWFRGRIRKLLDPFPGMDTYTLVRFGGRIRSLALSCETPLFFFSPIQQVLEYDRKKKGDKAAKEEEAKGWLRAQCEKHGWEGAKEWK